MCHHSDIPHFICFNYYCPYSSGGKVMFLQVSVCPGPGVYPIMQLSRSVCIPACNYQGVCLSQHAIVQGCVYPSMQLSRGVCILACNCPGVCIPACNCPGVCLSQHAIVQGCVYPRMQLARGVCIPACN